MYELLTIANKKMSFSQKIRNLKNSCKDKKALLFSCGKNINEYKDKINKFKENKEYIYVAYKSSIEYLNNECDIFIYDYFYSKLKDNIKSNLKIFYNDKKNSTNIYDFKLSPDIHFKYKKSHSFGFIQEDKSVLEEDFIEDNIILTNWIDVYFQIFFFLNYLGIKEIYLFGLYNCELVPNIYKNLVSKGSKINNTKNFVMKEPLDFIRIIQTEYLIEWALKNNIKLYNVSSEGAVTDKIPRILFDEIDKKNKETFIQKIPSINDYLDYDYYQEKYKCCKFIKNNKIDDNAKKQIINHYFTIGIYYCYCPNKETTTIQLTTNDFDLNLCKLAFFACLFPINKYQENKNILVKIYLIHVYHLLLFKKYDIKKICHLSKFKMNSNDTINYWKKKIKKKVYWKKIPKPHLEVINNYFSEFVLLYKLIHN